MLNLIKYAILYMSEVKKLDNNNINTRNYVKAKKTKRKIIDALFVLLDKKALDKITIQEICDEADIHRSTFYKHFGSIFDVINYLVQEIVEGMTEAFTDTDAHENVFEIIVELYQKNAKAIKNINKTKYKDILDNQIRQGLEEFIGKLFIMRKPESAEYVPEKWLISYHAAGILTLQEIFLTADLNDEITKNNFKYFFELPFK